MCDLEKKVLEELESIKRLVLRGDTVIPQFLVMTKEIEYRLRMPLGENDEEFHQTLRHLELFMQAKGARSYTAGIYFPDGPAVYVAGYSPEAAAGALSVMIRRNPPTFGGAWRDSGAQCGEQFWGVAKTPARVLEESERREVEELFGAGGKIRVLEIDLRTQGRT